MPRIPKWTNQLYARLTHPALKGTEAPRLPPNRQKNAEESQKQSVTKPKTPTAAPTEASNNQQKCRILRRTLPKPSSTRTTQAMTPTVTTHCPLPQQVDSIGGTTTSQTKELKQRLVDSASSYRETGAKDSTQEGTSADSWRKTNPKRQELEKF